MFINSFFIAVIFRLINFCAVIFLIGFAFKKYFLSDFLLKIAQKKSYLEALFTQQIMLEKEQTVLNEQLKEDALLCEKFKIKIDEWKATIHNEHKKLLQEQKNITQLIELRAINRSEYKEKERIQNKVLEQVTDQLEHSLVDYFQDPRHEEEYLEKILFFMNERAQ